MKNSTLKIFVAVDIYRNCRRDGFQVGPSVAKLRSEDAGRGQLFADGNYAMFIHWGVYSHLGNKVDDKTYYGNGGEKLEIQKPGDMRLQWQTHVDQS